MTVRLVNDATALLSMRDSDFDAYSALGEVVDNSIQAESTEVKIAVDFERKRSKGNRGYEIINEIAFGDNGTGMGAETLHRCMQLGYSSRYNDRSGIGRFGVGMTLAAINQCKMVEIYSKVDGGDWLHTYFDLDEITTIPPKMEGIPEPTTQMPPKKYTKLVGENCGTLVIWKKYDRQPCSASKMIDETRVWLGRTYRKFLINGDFTIAVDGEEIKVIDPLYVHVEKTRFPGDPASKKYDPIKIEWTVPLIEKPDYAPDESLITIRMSIIDPEFRSIKGSGGSKEARERYIDRNEGISILRNGREVFYGHIPYFKRKFEEIDRWWGCEIDFDAVLDRAFTVKNIKRGAVPTPDLRDAIYDAIKPTIDSVRESVRELWKQNAKNVREQTRTAAGGSELLTGHEAAENTAKHTATDKSEFDKGKNKVEEAQKLAEELKQDQGKKERDKWAAKFASQPFTIIEDSWKGPAFFETRHLGGADVIRYNLQHPYFEEVYSILDQSPTIFADKFSIFFWRHLSSRLRNTFHFRRNSRDLI